MSKTLPFVTLPNGEAVPAFGQGTWHMGENRRHAAAEEAALKLGIELGVNLIDTAEMYGNGTAEEIVARATPGLRDRLFIVSKVLPYNASQKGVVEACERSLKRLKTDRIDLYLLHWRGSVPLAASGLPFADRPVLDAFAGTGAFGLEALSRGASAAAFIEDGRDALAIIEVAAREELPAPAGFVTIDERVYGAARLVFLRPLPK